MLYRRPRIGQEINAFCGKCKLERTHIVAAMEGDTVRKVTCSMCKNTHNYRQKPAEKEPSARAASRATAKTGTTSRRSKQAEPFSIDPKRPVKSYSMDTSFSAGDVINHPKFGLGSVEVSLPPNKIEVRFQDGKRLLLHNMKNSR
jgi:hypothetical protein